MIPSSAESDNWDDSNIGSLPDFWDWRKTEHSQFDDHSQAYLPKMNKEHGTLISLNVEAIK